MNVHFTLAGLLWGAALCLNPPVPEPFGSFCDFSPSIAAPACAAVCLLHPLLFLTETPPSFFLRLLSHFRVTVRFFFILPRRARGPNQLPVKKLPRPDGWTFFFPFPDLSHTNNPIWVSLSYSCAVVKTLERYEVQMVHCPPTECFLFILFAIVHCVSVPDTRSCQRVCPAPEIQTRNPCSLSPSIN